MRLALRVRAILAGAAGGAGFWSARCRGCRASVALVGVVEARPFELDAACAEDLVGHAAACGAGDRGMFGHAVLNLEYIATCAAAIVVTCHYSHPNLSKAPAGLSLAGAKRVRGILYPIMPTMSESAVQDIHKSHVHDMPKEDRGAYQRREERAEGGLKIPPLAKRASEAARCRITRQSAPSRS